MIFRSPRALLLLFWWALLLICPKIFAKEVPLCEKLEQSIQGRKHGFLAGNLTYYVGGFHASWELMEDETIGLTHPFYHDLRSRGVGILHSELPGVNIRAWVMTTEDGSFTRTLASSMAVLLLAKRFTNIPSQQG